jgi:hypothetical protein
MYYWWFLSQPYTSDSCAGQCYCYPGNYCPAGSSYWQGTTCPQGSFCPGYVLDSVPCGVSSGVTGGIVTHSGPWEIHTFNESGFLDVSSYAATQLPCVMLLVGGGGGGGAGPYGGGGGAGAAVFMPCSFASTGPGQFSIVVGAGGTGGGSLGQAAPGEPGGASAMIFDMYYYGSQSVTAAGGGGGGCPQSAGQSGGCGGGAGVDMTFGIGFGGTDGGMSAAGGGGGGGGIGGGGAPCCASAPNGGAAGNYTIGGVVYSLGGGGGGGSSTAYGLGGGGGAGEGGGLGHPGTGARANTGSGGGGGGAGQASSLVGGAGSSGIVIVAFNLTNALPGAGPGQYCPYGAGSPYACPQNYFCAGGTAMPEPCADAFCYACSGTAPRSCTSCQLPLTPNNGECDWELPTYFSYSTSGSTATLNWYGYAEFFGYRDYYEWATLVLPISEYTVCVQEVVAGTPSVCTTVPVQFESDAASTSFSHLTASASYAWTVVGRQRPGQMQFGVDRGGWDMRGSPFVLSSADPSLCAAACESTAECTAWAYAIPGCDYYGLDPLCWLKQGVHYYYTSFNKCRVSAELNPQPFAIFANVTLQMPGA